LRRAAPTRRRRRRSPPASSSLSLLPAGGATALEGQAKGAASVDAPPSPGPAPGGIRLAGATSDVHLMTVRTGAWARVAPAGEPPSPRAAHAAAAVGNMVVVHGGIGPAGLASEDLHVLDFTDWERPRWHRVMVAGAGPSARYAHALSLVANRFLVAVGGNDGRSTLGDAWALDTSEKPYAWRRVEDAGAAPPPRMYATAAARADGLLLLCGGRDAAGAPLADAYGLARHRDGRWEWAAAPGTMPAPRYQHGAVFVGGRLHVLGGAVGGGRMVEEAAAVSVLDTGAGRWVGPGPAAPGADAELLRRCRHAMAAVGPYVFVHGGLKGSALLGDLLFAEDATAGAGPPFADARAPAWQTHLAAARGPEAAAAAAAAAAEDEAEMASMRRVSNAGDLHGLDPAAPGGGAAGAAPASAAPPAGAADGGTPSSVSLGGGGRPGEFPPGRDMPTPDVRLHHRAVVVAHEPGGGDLRGLVRQLSIDQFENEGRRVSMVSEPGGRARTPAVERPPPDPGVHRAVLRALLHPRHWRPPEDREFAFSADEICALCDAAEERFRAEPTVLRLRAPVKIFGDLHGQVRAS
jgi:hypothetical protein